MVERAVHPLLTLSMAEYSEVTVVLSLETRFPNCFMTRCPEPKEWRDLNIAYEPRCRSARGWGRENGNRRACKNSWCFLVAARILVISHYPIPGCVQRKRAQEPCRLSDPGDGRREVQPRSTRPDRRHSVFRPVYFVLDDCRVSCGSLQQAQRNHLDQDLRDRGYGASHRGAGMAKPASRDGCCFFGKHSGGSLRSFQVWLAAGIVAGAQALLGQWRARTRNLFGHHRWRRRGRFSS